VPPLVRLDEGGPALGDRLHVNITQKNVRRRQDGIAAAC
jgi:hypothetical protein